MIRSLHIVPRLDNRLGGSVHAALNVCKYLEQAGQPVRVVATEAAGDELGYLGESYAEVTYQTFPQSFPARYSNSEKMTEWVANNVTQYDIVEIHSVFTAGSYRAAGVCRKMGVPYLVRPHGSLDPFDLQKHSLLKGIIGPLFVARTLRNCSGVHCTARLEAERLVTYGASPAKYVSPLPVPLSGKRGNGQEFRRRNNIPQEAQVVLFMSRVDYKKGLDFLIPALGRLKAMFPRLHFVLAGTGDAEYAAVVGKLLDDCSVRKFTTAVGFVSGMEKADTLAAADIFALPSRNENFGIVVIEAMEAGVALLISDEVYIENEIRAANAGVVCRPQIDSVFTQLKSMLDGSININELASRGAQLARDRYHPQSATDALIGIYKQILRR
jgi:glycosyltransferase involved in cell wall biosynthesis